MDAQAVLEGAKDVITTKRVIGEPYEKNGITVIPVVAASGGGGGGGGAGPEGQGTGGGFGLSVKPLGAFVIKGEDVRWVPAIDVTRVILGGQLLTMVALLAIRSIVRSRTKRKIVREKRAIVHEKLRANAARNRARAARRR
jgi:uncharacterized spore protein YtfJ